VGRSVYGASPTPESFPGKDRSRPRPCENHFVVHLGARLLQTILITHNKGSLRAEPLFFCFVLTSSSSVFTQPRP
jgi:hypothetical protein